MVCMIKTAEHFRCFQHNLSFSLSYRLTLNPQCKPLIRQSYRFSISFLPQTSKYTIPQNSARSLTQEREPAVGSRSSMSRHLNIAVQRNEKQYCTLSGVCLPFWSPWGTSSHKTFPLPVVKHPPLTNTEEEPRCPAHVESETVARTLPLTS